MSYVMKKKLSNKKNYGAKRSTSNIKYIVIHYTANDGDHDESNANYFANNVIKASAHYFVDDDSVTQSVPDNYIAWSVGGSKYSNCSKTGGGKYYTICTNSNSISVELCDTKKDGKIYPTDATIINALDLTKKLMKKYNISQSHVIRHFDVTGKACPAYWCGNTKNNELWKTEFYNKLSSNNKTKYTNADFLSDLRKSFGLSANASKKEILEHTITISTKKNNKHKVIKPIQKYLNALGYNCGTSDGIVDLQFSNAVKEFQKKNKTNQDGEITARQITWKNLIGIK